MDLTSRAQSLGRLGEPGGTPGGWVLVECKQCPSCGLPSDAAPFLGLCSGLHLTWKLFMCIFFKSVEFRFFLLFGLVECWETFGGTQEVEAGTVPLICLPGLHPSCHSCWPVLPSLHGHPGGGPFRCPCGTLGDHAPPSHGLYGHRGFGKNSECLNAGCLLSSQDLFF